MGIRGNKQTTRKDQFREIAIRQMRMEISKVNLVINTDIRYLGGRKMSSNNRYLRRNLMGDTTNPFFPLNSANDDTSRGSPEVCAISVYCCSYGNRKRAKLVILLVVFDDIVGHTNSGYQLVI